MCAHNLASQIPPSLSKGGNQQHMLHVHIGYFCKLERFIHTFQLESDDLQPNLKHSEVLHRLYT